MNVTEPIRKSADVEALQNYYLEKGNLRNATLITTGLYTALRVGDLISLKWGDIYNFKMNKFKDKLYIKEKKTGKKKEMFINDRIKVVAKQYMQNLESINENDYMFPSIRLKDSHIRRETVYRIIKKATEETGIEGVISCHSLRKTFGYFAWQGGTPPSVLMHLFNHSCLEVTKRYLCISQDDVDNVYKNMTFE